MFTEGLYKPLRSETGEKKDYVWIGRMASLSVVALAIVLQTTFTDVIDALKFLVKTIAPIGISFWVGIVWRGWTPTAVWISSLTSYAVWAACAYFPQWPVVLGVGDTMVYVSDAGPKVSDAWTMFLYLAAGLVSGLLVSLVTPRTPREKLDRFFLLLRTPVRKGERVQTPCTLPDDPLPPVPRLFTHPDIELPRPTAIGVAGFLLAWVFVGIIACLPSWLIKL